MKVSKSYLFLALLFIASLVSAQQEIYQTDQVQQIQFQQQTNVAPEPLQAVNSFNQPIANSSANPEFRLSSESEKSLSISTVKTLVPYEDL